MKLTRAQLAAITHAPGNLQLIACAGSGKTEVVAQRVAHFLKDGQCKPANIIAFTFTDKAAGELKDRIVIRCRQQLGDIHGLAEMYVGSIHAYCLDLLKTEAPQYLKYEVINEVQQILLVDRYSKQSGLTASSDLKGRPLKRYLDTHHYLSALGVLRESTIRFKQLKGCSVAVALQAYRTLFERSDFSTTLAFLRSPLMCWRTARRRGRRWPRGSRM